MRRFCASEGALGEPYCLEHSNGQESFKDCYTTCSNDVENGGSIACNSGTEVYDLFKPADGEPTVTSCKVRIKYYILFDLK